MRDFMLCVYVIINYNLVSGNFPLPFGKVRLSNFVTRVLHMQHDYFSSFIQSDLCFMALSLLL